MIPVSLRAGSYSDADGHSWLRPHPRSRNRTTLPFRPHSSDARSSRQCASRGGLLHCLSRAAGEQVGCQHYRSAARPKCHFDRSLRRRPHRMFSGGVLMNLRPMMFSSSIMLFGLRLPAGVILHGDTRVVLVVSLAVAVAVLKSALPKRIRSDGRVCRTGDDNCAGRNPTRRC
jgi:hypothetical protein